MIQMTLVIIHRSLVAVPATGPDEQPRANVSNSRPAGWIRPAMGPDLAHGATWRWQESCPHTPALAHPSLALHCHAMAPACLAPAIQLFPQVHCTHGMSLPPTTIPPMAPAKGKGGEPPSPRGNQDSPPCSAQTQPQSCPMCDKTTPRKQCRAGHGVLVP